MRQNFNYQLKLPHLQLTRNELDDFLSYKAAVIKNYLEKPLNPESRKRAYVGINDFCYHYPKQIKDYLRRNIGLSNNLSDFRKIPPLNTAKVFAKRLLQLNGDCVFLLMDAFEAFDEYKMAGGRGFAIPINRGFLCKDEQDYLMLASLFDRAFLRANDLNQCLKLFEKEFARLIRNNSHFRDRAHVVNEWVKANHTRGRIIFVDIGFQFTFVLFCYAAVRLLSKSIVDCDFFAFTAYPWLQDLFGEKIFSNHNEYGVHLESRGRDRCITHSLNKAKGCFMGFAIGDALGYPLAGISKNEAAEFVPYPIKGFECNKQHPYFRQLNAGQYTDNTRLMLVSADYLSTTSSFKLENYVKILTRWGQTLLQNPHRQRWLGQTTFHALQRLAHGISPARSGDRKTKSCGALFRVVPFAIHYNEKILGDWQELSKLVQEVGGITHNSTASKAGCSILTLIIALLLNFNTPEGAIRIALNRTRQHSKHNKLLYKQCHKAFASYRHMTISQARDCFGTGSHVTQTLPLALFCFLKYHDGFGKCVLAAANSCREDSTAAKRYLSRFSWEESLVKCIGGNTDGIAAIAGALIGCSLGSENIPKQYRSVESHSLLQSKAEQLWKLGKGSIKW